MAKIGEQKCCDIDCKQCPFSSMAIGFCLDFNSNLTLNEGFEMNKRFIPEARKETIRKMLKRKYFQVRKEEEDE